MFLVVASFQHSEFIMPIPLDYRVSAEESADSIMVVPLYFTSCFSLTAFKILFLTVDSLIMCFGVDLFGCILFGTFCDS